jgi:hypothetical protein
MRRSIITVTIALVALSSCGGSGSASGTTAAGTSDSAVSTLPVDTSPTPTGDVAVNDIIGKAKDFCEFQKELNNMKTPFDDSAATKVDFYQYFEGTVRPAVAKLQELAPDKIADDVTTLSQGLTKFVDIFKTNGYDPARAYADPDLKAIAQDDGYNSAGKAVDKFCGF